MADPETTRVPTPPADPVPPSAEPSSMASAPPGPNAPPPPAPAWRPPASDSGRNASLIFGAILLVLGAWFFATRTLGLDLPDLDWGTLWPVVLIGIGAWIVYGALRQRSR